jgi:predicted metal-dependent peptidase
VALAELCQRMPGFAGLALWLRHVERPDETKWYACTDGTNIFYGRPFWDIDTREQWSTQAHEVLHAALRHPYRLAVIAGRLGPQYNNSIGQCAADAIVNSAMGTRPWFKLTSADPTIEAVMAEAKELRTKLGLPTPPGRDPCDRTIRQWSLESLYGFLNDLVKEACKAGIGQDEGPLLLGERGPSRIGGDMILIKHAERDPNGIGGEGITTETREQELEDRTRAWSRRLMGLSGGRDTGAMVQALSGDMPQVRTPWEHHLRTVVASQLAPAMEPTWTKPSRRGSNTPGWKRSKPVPDLVVIQDTSGSVDQAMRTRFAAEIAGIARRRGARITVISADAAVTEVVEARTDDVNDTLKRLRFIGGGGTNFAPALAAAKKRKPDAIVYLTDLAGEFGPDPHIPVIWAVPEGDARAGEKPPFGRLIELY